MYKLLIFSLLSLVISCSISKTRSISETPIAGKSIDPTLIFFNFSVKKRNSEIQITPINTILTKGLLKSTVDLNENEIDDLLICQEDEYNNILDSQILSNPLVKTVEIYGDKGELYKKTILLDSIECGIRMPLNPKASQIAIYQKIDSVNNKLLVRQVIQK